MYCSRGGDAVIVAAREQVTDMADTSEREDLACCERLATVFRTLGNATRLGILRRIIDDGMCVGELQSELGRSQPNISQHLTVLRDRGMVMARREGNRMCYTLAEPRVVELLELAERIFHSDEEA